jgi:hypothetical protein
MPDCNCPQHVLTSAYRASRQASIRGKRVRHLTKCEYPRPDVPFRRGAYPQLPAQAVDEFFRKKFCVHKVKIVFPQVRGIFRAEQIFFPQLFPQAVHKHGLVVHRLSTGSLRVRVGACPAGGYGGWGSDVGCESPGCLEPAPGISGATSRIRAMDPASGGELSVLTAKTDPSVYAGRMSVASRQMA